jgi:hypothetical protein
MQLHLWYCHSEICRRLNKCADALQVMISGTNVHHFTNGAVQRLNTVETRYVSMGYIRPHLFLMQVCHTSTSLFLRFTLKLTI